MIIMTDTPSLFTPAAKSDGVVVIPAFTIIDNIAYKDFEDMIRHFEHRQQVEMRIIREVIGENAQILTAKNVDIESLQL